MSERAVFLIDQLRGRAILFRQRAALCRGSLEARVWRENAKLLEQAAREMKRLSVVRYQRVEPKGRPR
jgi:hypothetical protein